MLSDDFNNIIDARIKIIRKTLQKKGAEYASTLDRLSNFKQAAALRQTTPLDALGGMVAKQIVSIFDMILTFTPSEPNYLLWDEKITDVINYMILLDALIIESKLSKPSPLSPDEVES